LRGRPEGEVIVVVGDGGFGHGWAEMETAARCEIAVTIVALNNGVLGYCRLGTRRCHIRSTLRHPAARMAMTQIVEGNSPLTLINVFTVAPDKADELVRLLNQATEEVMRYQAGFISANIHLSLDRRHVTNYAQWRTEEDFEAMQKVPDVQKHMKACAALAEKFEPSLYTVESVHEH
jgi:quinol monooxygenase YgiN